MLLMQARPVRHHRPSRAREPKHWVLVALAAELLEVLALRRYRRMQSRQPFVDTAGKQVACDRKQPCALGKGRMLRAAR
jgi:hypothetical protein